MLLQTENLKRYYESTKSLINKNTIKKKDNLKIVLFL
jgi:hypothetical protein